jgi:adenylate cyclase
VKHVVGLLLGLPGAAIALALSFLGVLDPVERTLYDLESSARPSHASSDALRLVMATDHDVTALGPWPWDRRVHAQLVQCMHEAGARSIGFDVLFEGPGRSVDGDRLLAETVARAGNVVVGFSAEMGDIPLDRAPPAELIERSSTPVPPGSRFVRASRVVVPSGPLGGSVLAIAFLNAPPDIDGTLRRLWPVLEFNGRLFPSLALALCLAHERADMSAVDVGSDGSIRFPRRDGGETVVPLDEEGRMLVCFAGPSSNFEFRSYSDVFRSYLEGGVEALGSRERIVLVGNVMSSVSDVRPTPVEGETPGVFVHAAALSNLLENRFLRAASDGMTAFAILLAALTAGWCGFTARGGWRFVASPVAVLLPAAAAFALFSLGDIVLPMAAPVLAGFVALVTSSVIRGVGDGRRRREVDQVFRRLVPVGILDQIVADPSRHLNRVERAEVSMLAVRITGWDGVRLAPEEEAELLREVFAVVGREVQRENGTLVRLAADGAFSIYNRPFPVAGHAGAAARTSLTLRDAVRRLNATWIHRTTAPLGVASALHTGVVTVGTVGSEFHAEYMAFGREVNVTMALLAPAGENEVLASERFHASIAADFECALRHRTPGGQEVYEISASLCPDATQTDRLSDAQQ